MGILVADRAYLGEIGVLDEGMKVYGGENVELGIRVSKPLQIKTPNQAPFRCTQFKQELTGSVFQLMQSTLYKGLFFSQVYIKAGI